jgi:hypothetical protein
MVDLLSALKLAGNYSVQILNDRHKSVVRCTFQNKEDADRLANAVAVKSETSLPGFARLRSFVLSDEVRATIRLILSKRQSKPLYRPHGQKT